MENNKPKQLPYEDDFEWGRNMIRILIIVLYTPMTFLLVSDGFAAMDTQDFLSDFRQWPSARYFFFFAPLGMSLIDLYLVSLEKKSGVPMQRVSKHFIYGSWVVSVAFYGLFVLGLF